MPIKHGTWPKCLLIAGRDIHVYKVFKVTDKPNKFLPPFKKGMTYKIGGEYTTVIACEDNAITKGFHCFGELCSAIIMRDSMIATNYPSHYKVIECIIPKGSVYVPSCVGTKMACNRIKLLREI